MIPGVPIVRKRYDAKRHRYVARSLTEYIDTTMAITDAWIDEEAMRFRPWFRGQAHAGWKLTPGVYRKGVQLPDESMCRWHFRRRAYPYLSNSPALPETDWDWYFLMQHYGFPTRLLDWTESALLGLFFAVREPSAKGGAAVWILDPWWFNERIAGQGNKVFFWDDLKIASHLPPDSDGSKTRLPPIPVALRPPHTSSRIAAQQSVFTIHGSRRRGLEAYDAMGDRLFKVVIPQSVRPRIHRELEIAGVTETSIFPELASVSRELLLYFLPASSS